MFPKKAPTKILFVTLSNIGDVISSLPVLEDLAASMSAMDIDAASPGAFSMAPMDISADPVLGPHRGKCNHVRGVSVCQHISAEHCALGTLELASKNQEIQWVFRVDEHTEKAVDIMLAWIDMRRKLLCQGKLDSGKPHTFLLDNGKPQTFFYTIRRKAI